VSKGSKSRENTVISAAALFRQNGYNGTALQDILAVGRSPRGSLYFHFPKGKEQIGEAAINLAASQVREAIAAAAGASKTAEDFVTSIVGVMATNLENSNFSQGCPIATIALETAAQSEVLRTAASNAFKSWENDIRTGLESFGMKSDHAEIAAASALSLLEGALLLARTHRSLEPMRRAEAAVKFFLTAAAAE
jgi:TetR/AcrR family transcriptional repressor of lmrAB and yxaGH operons